ncbi:hypothetical protein [Streptomyces sp. SID3343]|uniref:hypothetical protein n=1 Tax=Streptomyces sp. SID3343 TaxID=2690260 RepID=UPI00136D53F0|nr:hypothetical protein [Streptomyces sp. SID3343]
MPGEAAWVVPMWAPGVVSVSASGRVRSQPGSARCHIRAQHEVVVAVSAVLRSVRDRLGRRRREQALAQLLGRRLAFFS